MGAITMKSLYAVAILLGVLRSGTAYADDRSACAAAAGSFVTGTVLTPPVFEAGASLKHVELSHTHVMLRPAAGGTAYDVAMDDVFAAGYDQAGNAVPAPLNGIKVGDTLELCGELYGSGEPGIHWVHTDCGDPPSRKAPKGWVKEIAADGSVGPNLEGSQEYCSLWSR